MWIFFYCGVSNLVHITLEVRSLLVRTALHFIFIATTLSVHVLVIYHPVLDELPAIEHTEVLETLRDLIFRYTGERLCNFGAGQTTVSNLVQLPFRIHGEGHESAFEYH